MSEIIAYASTSEFRKNHLMSAAQYKNALSKNVAEFDIPLVAKSDLDKHRALIETIFKAVYDHPENSALGSTVRQIVTRANLEGF